jgi:hypothetical protein
VANIIIKGKNSHQKFGRTRSEQEENMRKEWGETMTDEQLDKLKFAEKKERERTGTKKNFITGIDIDKVN